MLDTAIMFFKFFFFFFQSRPGNVAQLVKYLVYKYEELSLIIRNCVKKKENR